MSAIEPAFTSGADRLAILFHHFFDSKNNILTDIESNKIQLTNIPPPPSGKKIKNIEVVINIDNDSH